MTQQFFKPEPTRPEDSQIVRALKWSLRVSVIGWAIYGPFAFAFADLGIVPASIQSAFVLLGSALIVVGGETNTVPTLIAALSKVGTGRFSVWDAAAVVASLIGSLCNVLITFSTRQVKLAGTPWREFAVIKGPLYLGIAATLDLYGAILEKALIKRDYELDWATWWEEKLVWDHENGIAPAPPPAPAALVFDESWETAKQPWFEKYLGQLNGTGYALTKKQLVKAIYDSEQNLPHPSTIRRWLKLAEAK
jgi:hypothetical protein